MSVSVSEALLPLHYIHRKKTNRKETSLHPKWETMQPRKAFVISNKGSREPFRYEKTHKQHHAGLFLTWGWEGLAVKLKGLLVLEKKCQHVEV